MSKIIIENRSGESDLSAMRVCMEVIKKGRVSVSAGKKQYCYATRIQFSGEGELMVYASLNKNSDKFTVTDS